MVELCDDIWNYYRKKDHVVCITTNGCVSSNTGKAIMGRGIALQARLRIPGIDLKLAKLITQYGNIPFWMDSHSIIIFPTKYHWRDKSPLDLIRLSAEWLDFIARRNTNTYFLIPRPGCGNGGRDWETEVFPIMSKLPDNVWVTTLPIEKSSYPHPEKEHELTE